MLPLGQVNHLALGPKGLKIIGRNTADPARWKRYKGGTAGHLWIDVKGNGEFRRMNEIGGNVTSPMWIDGRVYYLSDHEGVGNLYSCLPDGSELARHTDHDTYYARHASTDGTRIVYQCGADIWLFDPASDTVQRLDIQTLSHRTQAVRKFVKAEDHLGPVHIHPAGHSIAVDARGKLFSFALWGRRRRQLGAPDGVRYRHGQWLDDGTTVVAVSDASGDERVVVFDGDSSRELPWDIGRVVAMKAAPRPPCRSCEPPQRGADRRPPRQQDHAGRPQRMRTERRSRGRPTVHGLHTHRNQYAAPGNQTARAGDSDQHDGDPARVSGLQSIVRSRRTVSVLLPHCERSIRSTTVFSSN